MSLEQPSMAESYLHQVLVNGVTPFRYRSNVHSLLGMPDSDANITPAAVKLPSFEFLYATRLSPDVSHQGEWQADETWVDGGVSPSFMSSPLGYSSVEILKIQAQIATHQPEVVEKPLTSTVSPPSDRTPSSVETLKIQAQIATHQPGVVEQPLTSTDSQLSDRPPVEIPRKQAQIATHQQVVERPQPPTSTAEVPASTPIKSEVQTKAKLSDTNLENQPTAITIPGITNHRTRTGDISRQGTGNREQGLSVTGDLSPRQDLPPRGEGLKPNGGEREQTDEVLPVARSLFPLPKGVDLPISAIKSPQQLSNSRVASSTEKPQGINPMPVAEPPVRGLPTPHTRLIPLPVSSESNMPYSPAIAPQPAAKVTEELTKLRRVVAELKAQVTAQQEFQRPVAPTVLPPPAPIRERPISLPKPPQAFWERSYLSRLYRW